MFLVLPDPDPLVRCMDPDPDLDLDPSTTVPPCKNSKKNLDSYYFVTLYNYLPLDLKKKICWHLEGQ